MKLQRRYRRALLLLALLIGVVAWLLVRWTLSPLERSVLGSWYYTGTDQSTGVQGIAVMELHSDRRCFIRLSDIKAGTEIRATDGRWRIDDGVLTCDWRGRWTALLPAIKLSWTSWPRSMRLDDTAVISVSDSELIVRKRSNEPFTWKRYHGSAVGPKLAGDP
jgi:hypothetical protein